MGAQGWQTRGQRGSKAGYKTESHLMIGRLGSTIYLTVRFKWNTTVILIKQYFKIMQIIYYIYFTHSDNMVCVLSRVKLMSGP